MKVKKKAEDILGKFQDRFIFKNKRFSQLIDLKIKNENIRGIIFDLGYSYNQIKDSSKGLSFNALGDLNMKMGLNDFSAKDAINKLNETELEKIFKFFGEENESKKIAKNIINQRKIKKMDTKNLVELIEKVKRKKNFRTHSATKVFQALRIFVNKEISELVNGLIAASKVLGENGVLAVVTFHSIEDRIVKYFFKSLSENKSVSRYVPKLDQPETSFKMIKKKPIVASVKELRENPPSRSAKLRYIIKKSNFYNFETDIHKKFENLIEIENFGNKL